MNLVYQKLTAEKIQNHLADSKVIAVFKNVEFSRRQQDEFEKWLRIIKEHK